MSNTTHDTTYDTPRTLGQGYLFGVPMKDLGWFASLLMGLTTGFMGFFAATFFAIVSIMVYNSSGHHAIDYSYSYTRVGLPVGIFCAVVALGYLGTMWAKRQVRQQ
jgi:ABC-type dipeptide/oligopeptide/nickel transport system permease subunit